MVHFVLVWILFFFVRETGIKKNFAYASDFEIDARTRFLEWSFQFAGDNAMRSAGAKDAHVATDKS